jgi:ADP-heptose:LPS heptosyltransferase
MKPSPDIKDILFISMGGIGNMVMLTPAIQLVSSHWPGARLHFLLGPFGSRAVVELHPRCAAIIETPPDLSHFTAAVNQCRRHKPGLVFPATGTNPLKCGLIGLLCGSPVRLGEHFGAGRFLYTHQIPFDPALNETRANILLAQHITGATDSPPPAVWSSPDDTTAAMEIFSSIPRSGRYIGLHAGAGEAMQYKRWPPERFTELARRIIRHTGHQVLVFGGQSEAGMARSLAGEIGDGATCLAGRLSVRQSYEAMKRCALFISSDSGPMHLAAAAGCRIVALFGPTDPSRSGPWGSGHTILRGTCDKGPCYRGKKITCPDFSCMSGISVAQVWTAVERALAALPS